MAKPAIATLLERAAIIFKGGPVRALVERLVMSVARVVRDVDAALATGSISNARQGVQENVRRRDLERATGLSQRGSSTAA